MINELHPNMAMKLILTPFLFLKRKDKGMLYHQEYLGPLFEDLNKLAIQGTVTLGMRLQLSLRY